MWETLTRRIADESGKELATTSELKELKRIQAANEMTIRAIQQHTESAAKVAWTANQAELQKHIATGTLNTLDGWTASDYVEDFAEKQQVFKSELRRLCGEAIPIVEKVAHRFAEVATAFASEEEKAERLKYERFGFPYNGPSELVLTLKKAAEFALARVPRSPYATGGPREMLPYIVDL